MRKIEQQIRNPTKVGYNVSYVPLKERDQRTIHTATQFFLRFKITGSQNLINVLIGTGDQEQMIKDRHEIERENV